MTLRILVFLVFISTTSFAAHHDIDVFPLDKNGQLSTVNFSQGDGPSLAYSVRTNTSPMPGGEETATDAYYLESEDCDGPVYDPIIHPSFQALYGYNTHGTFLPLSGSGHILLETLLDLIEDQKAFLHKEATEAADARFEESLKAQAEAEEETARGIALWARVWAMERGTDEGEGKGED